MFLQRVERVLSNIRKNHTHAVMFHHFYNENHPMGQGALSADQFTKMIDWLSEHQNLLNADEFFYKWSHNSLDKKDTCLTFDDALLCQKEIAAPILKSRNLQAFFFVYSSPFKGTPDFLEIYRYFRTTEFGSLDCFYTEFFEEARNALQEKYREFETGFDEKEYLKPFPFYTKSDKWFRFLRDIALGKEKYEDVMARLMAAHAFKPREAQKKLWMSDLDLKSLQSDGHVIGLHSFSHPTTLHLLSKEAQAEEYRKNFSHLNEILGITPFSMSHPCGNYSKDTLDILMRQGIKIGFRSNMGILEIKSGLEIPREDHSNIFVEMSK